MERARVARTLGAQMADDAFRRTPEALGRLTPEGVAAVARGSGRDLTDAIERTGARWREAETHRPRTPAPQVAAELQRAQLGMEPFRAFDRVQERAREVQRELARAAKRALGLDRDRGRGL